MSSDKRADCDKRKGLPYPSEISEETKSGRLTSRESFVLHVLRGSMNQKNRSCWKTGMTLAAEMNCARSSVTKAIASLKLKGFLKISKRKSKTKIGFDRNEYRIVFPWPEELSDASCMAHTKSTCVAAKKANVCSPGEHIQGRVTSSNISKRNRSIKNNQHQYAGDDETFFNTTPKRNHQQKILSKKFTYEKSGLSGSQREFVSDPHGFPKCGEERLRQFYGANVPPAVELLNESRGFDLHPYVRPFGGKGKDLIEEYGVDFDLHFEAWVECDMENFYEKVISALWLDYYREQPHGGFKKVFLRAMRAGVMYRTGFRLKSRKEIELEQQMQKEKVVEYTLEELREKKEEDRKIAEKLHIMQIEQERKDAVLYKFVNQTPVMEYLNLIGFKDINESGLNEIRQHIMTIKNQKRIKNQEKLVKFFKKESRAINKRLTMQKNRQLLTDSLINDISLRRFFIKKGLLGKNSVTPFKPYEINTCHNFVDDVCDEHEYDNFQEGLELIAKRARS